MTSSTYSAVVITLLTPLIKVSLARGDRRTVLRQEQERRRSLDTGFLKIEIH